MTRAKLKAAFPHFYPDSSNALDVTGEIGEGVFNAIKAKVPTVNQTGDTLCLSINSPGGKVEFLLQILQLLQTERENRRGPLVTTVAGAECKSAAAELLIAGDYAIIRSDSQMMLHWGGVNPPPGMDINEVLRCGMTSIPFRVEFARDMVTLRFIKRALICNGRENEGGLDQGHEGLENIMSGKAIIECINMHGRQNPRITQQNVRNSLASLCRHIETQDIVECLAANSSRLQCERLEGNASAGYRYMRFVAKELCQVHFKSIADINYSGEEAYWLGFVDEVQGTKLPNTREWIEQTCLD